MTDVVRYERHGRVGVITLDRPEARNAINSEAADGIEAAIDQVESDPDVWAAVLTGRPPVFCAGADLKAIAAGQASRLSTRRGGFAGLVRRRRSTPLIAAVDGPALAGGAEIVLACDLVVASTTSSFGLPEVKRSLIPAAGGLFRLPRSLPRNLAIECLLTGDPISAERAHAFGLVNALCEPGAVVAEALRLAARISANAPLAVQETRAAALALLDAGDREGWARSSRAWQRVEATDDFQEGPRAFAEKRSPVWRGR